MLADARPPGRANDLWKTDGKTYLPQSTLDELNAKLDLTTYANYGDRSLAMDIYRPKDSGGNCQRSFAFMGRRLGQGETGRVAKIAQALAAHDSWRRRFPTVLSGEARVPRGHSRLQGRGPIPAGPLPQRFLGVPSSIKLGCHRAFRRPRALGRLVGYPRTGSANRKEGQRNAGLRQSHSGCAVPMGAQTDLPVRAYPREVSK